MFITNEAHRLRIPSLLGGPQQTQWMAVELALNSPWFLVTFKELEVDSTSETREYFSFHRSVLVDSIESVERLIQSNHSDQIQFVSIQIFTPGYMNGTNEWKMETLDSVQEGHHPDFESYSVDVFVTSDGHRYSHLMGELPIDELSLGEIRFKAPRK
jgi:hypothetical protein